MRHEESVLRQMLEPTYEALGLARPRFVWCADPAQFARTVGEVRFADAMARSDLGEPRPDHCACPECLGVDVTDRVEHMLEAETERAYCRVLIDAIRTHDPSVVGPLEVRTHPAGCIRPGRRFAWGIRSAHWSFGRFNGVADAWVFSPSTAVILQPGSWRTDDRGQLHDSLEGPALAWGEWQVPFHHGLMLPIWATDPWEMSVERILGERNVEVRRCLIERYGLERFVADNPAARLLDDDPVRGQLWDIGVDSNREPMVMVRVIDATPTPSGDHKVYWLRVPPTVGTAHDAVAWTFDIDPRDYLPEVQT